MYKSINTKKTLMSASSYFQNQNSQSLTLSQILVSFFPQTCRQKGYFKGSRPVPSPHQIVALSILLSMQTLKKPASLRDSTISFLISSAITWTQSFWLAWDYLYQLTRHLFKAWSCNRAGKSQNGRFACTRYKAVLKRCFNCFTSFLTMAHLANSIGAKV